MNLIHTLGVSASALAAERFRMDVISTNLANANTMRIGGNDPYRRKIVSLLENYDGSVSINGIVEDMSPFRVVQDPGNPYADSEGLVYYSNTNPITEMVDMISASRAYEANLNAFNLTKQMLQSALDIGRV
ncbi:MAG TPA: flagellar basal body rod protein FlgC [Fimbriimonadales bacterium]|nr:flagellar basal body rod protein FlgC [Fimbriimonadales bacterium]